MIRTLAYSAVAFAALSLSAPGSYASSTFILPANDGYGVADCLAHGGECALTVANAWCSAQGYHHASGMRPATPGSSQRPASREAIAITCDN